MNELDANERAKSEIHKLFMETVGAPPANDPIPARKELDDARRRVNLSFGQALVGLSVVLFVASFSTRFDLGFSVIFGVFGLVLLVVGAFHIDRANAADKSLMKDWLSK